MSSMYGSPTGAPSRLSASARSGEAIPKGYKKGSIQQFTPEMMQLFEQMMGQLGPDSFLSKIAAGDEEAFSQMEAPAMRQFQGMQGQLASRFSGMGMGGRKSSGFQNTANNAASEFAQQLQSQRMGLQSQALRDLQSMGNQLLGQRPYENFLSEKKPNFLEAILGPLGAGMGQGAGEAGGMAMMMKLLPLLGLI